MTEAAPTLTLTGDPTVDLGNLYTLNATFTDPGQDVPITWLIDWGDGHQQEYGSALPGLAHEYTSAGGKTITVTAATEDGSYSQTLNLSVNSPAPTVSAYASGPVEEGQAAWLNLGYSDNLLSSPTSWTIDWGDGNTQTYAGDGSQDTSVPHIYSEANSAWPVSVSVTSPVGTFTTSTSVQVSPDAPVFYAGTIPTVAGGGTVTLRPYFDDADGDPVTYTVDWGDQTSQSSGSRGDTFTHTYDASLAEHGGSEVYVNVTAVSEDGTYTATNRLVVYDPGNASLSGSAPGSAVEGSPVTLSGSFHDANQVNPGAIVEVDWGDGTVAQVDTSGDYTMTHVYAEPGIYPLILGAAYGDTTDSQNNLYMTQSAGSVIVAEATPTFTLDGPSTLDSSGGITVTPTFTDPGGEPAQYIQVDWGDNTITYTTSGAHLSHQYTTGASQFSIVAHATSDDGTYDSSPLQVNDPAGQPVVSVDNVYPNASEQGQSPGTVLLTREDDGRNPVTVSYTLSGTADPASDYIVTDENGNLLNGTITLPPGQGYDTDIVITPIDDSIPEWTETATVTLNSGTGYTVDPAHNSGTVDIQDNDLGVRLDNGSGNIVLQGSSDGTQNLVPLCLNVPQAINPGATVTLSVNSPNEVDVWTTPSPGSGDTPILGGSGLVSTYTWTEGQSGAVPTELWVGATAGSASVGDIQFMLADSDASASPPVSQPTTNTAATQPASAVELSLDAQIVPNGGTKGDNWAGKTENWLIGQMVDLKADLIGPAPLIANPTYQWTTQGSTEHLWLQQGAGASAVALSADSVDPVSGAHTGTRDKEIQFFWVNTANGRPENDTVSVSVSANGRGYTGSTTFAVQPPPATAHPAAHGTVAIAGDDLAFQNPGAAIVVGASVQQPAGFAAGQWTFLQLVDSNDEYDHWQNNGTVDRYRYTLNGTWVLDGAQFPLPVALGLIVDPNNFKPVASNPLPTGPDTWDWADNAATQVTGNGVDVGIGGQNGADLHEVIRNDHYQLMLMYLPPGSRSQWVPLQAMTWSWGVDAKDPLKNAKWQIVSATNPTDSGWAAATSEPQWSTSWATGGWQKQ